MKFRLLTYARQAGSPTPAGSAAALSAPVKWGLIATVVATVAALVWPDKPVVVATSRSPDSRAPGTPRDITPDSAPSTRIADAAAEPLLAGGLATFATASGGVTPSFDPFAGIAPPPPPAPVAASQPVAAPPPPPPPPPMLYRFGGRVTGPDGTQQVFLAKGDAFVPISQGATLDDGYVVDSISDDAVVLMAPKLGTRVSLSARSASQ